MNTTDNHDYWSDKKKMWMWFLEPGARELKLAELMVYCYRTYQDEYDQTPSIKKICRATGLSNQTITNADHRLIDAGLLETDRAVRRPTAGWFQMKRPATIETLSGKHWRHHYTHWELLVRHPKTAQGRMTHAYAALVSYLWHCRKTNFEPKEGWSVAYLAKVLRCKWETVKEGLLVLNHLGMVRHETTVGEGLKLWLYKPTAEHLALFQDAEKPRAFRPASCTIGVEDGPVSCGRMLTPSKAPEYTFEDILKKVKKLTEYDGEEAEDLAYTLVEREPVLEQVAIDLHRWVWGPLHKRRLRLERMVCENNGHESAV